ncbi:unnamed protein product [Thlaspi arvense]|uniref:Protein kinase domain-containing protein n=1 Tax=Thlaspi arvense TaxID=13288 RepID=A0AAU9RHS0_THLAR|nr:unnamed protein product [Thlaspi arvense]
MGVYVRIQREISFPQNAVFVASMWRLGLRGGGGGGESYPERPDEPDCIYYLRTGVCVEMSVQSTSKPCTGNNYLSVFYFLIKSWEVSEQKVVFLISSGTELKESTKAFFENPSLMLADKLINRVEYMHTRGFIHLEINPDNFLIRCHLGELLLNMNLLSFHILDSIIMCSFRKTGRVYIIDFGLGKKYRDLQTHRHILYKENKNLTGTVRYAKCEHPPWSHWLCAHVFPQRKGLKAGTKKHKYDIIREKKVATPVEVMCLSLFRSLRFDDKPDHSYPKRLLRDLFIRDGYQFDYVFDWTVLKYPQICSSSSSSRDTGNNLFALLLSFLSVFKRKSDKIFHVFQNHTAVEPGNEILDRFSGAVEAITTTPREGLGIKKLR